MTVRQCQWLIMAAVGLATAGCYQTPQQKLVGRWYNAEMSIRFQEDGSVRYNSAAGLSRGRYEFVPTPMAPGSQSGTPNLIVEVNRPGQRVRYHFEAVFLAHDRLRLHDLSPHSSNQTNESIHQFAVLKRAAEPANRAGLAR